MWTVKVNWTVFTFLNINNFDQTKVSNQTKSTEPDQLKPPDQKVNQTKPIEWRR